MPIYEVESNGVVYEVDAPDPQTAARALTKGRPDPKPAAAAAAPAPAPAAPAPQKPTGLVGQVADMALPIVQSVRGVPEAARTVAQGLGAQIVGGVNAVTSAVVPGASQFLGSPTEAIDRAQQTLGYAPQTPEGQAAIAPLQAFGEKYGAATNWLGEGTTDLSTKLGMKPEIAAAFGATVKTLGDVAPFERIPGAAMRGARAFGDAAIERGAARMPNPIRPMGEASARARQVNYRLTPDAVTTQRQLEAPLGQRPGDAPGKLTAQIAGPEANHAIVIENQKNSDALAMRELGVESLSPERLQMEAAKHNGPYNELVRVSPTLYVDDQMRAALMQLGEQRRSNPWLQSNPRIDAMAERMGTVEGSDMQDALTAIRELRRESRVLYQSVDDPAKLQAAEAYRAAADALEQGIDRQVGMLFPEMVPAMRAAREAQAKIHNVEDSLVGGPGNYHVDPGVLAKIGEKSPLSGWLKEITDFHNNFPQLSASKVGSSNPSFQMSSPGAAGNPRHWFNRTFGEQLIPRMLSDSFQNRFGRFEPGYDPNTPAFAPRAPQDPATGLPFEPTPNVMPPQQGGAGGLGEALDPMAQVDTLPPADAFPGDLTASQPPVQDGLPFTPQDVGVAEAMALDTGLVPPGSRFTGGPDVLPFDNGLDFTIDPTVDSASIVRGGPDPRTVQDSLLSEELIARPGENLGRPLDFETADRIAPLDEEMVTRPAPGLGEDLALMPEPGTALEPYVAQGEFIQGTPPPRQRPGKFDGAEDAIGPDQLPPPPDAPLGEQFPSGPPRLPAPEGGAAFDLPDPTLPVSEDARNVGRGIGRRIAEGERAKRAAQERALGDELTLEDSAPRQTAREFEGGDTPELGAGEFELKADNRRIILKDVGGRLQIQRTNVDPSVQAKGLGQQNIMDALAESEKRGVPLDGGITMTRAALRPWRSLERKGAVEFDGNLDEIEKAIDANGGITKERPDGKPWITNIRRGPAG